MRASKIEEVFSSAGIEVPDWLSETINGADYDDVQDWCCGLTAAKRPEGVLVQRYCWKGRGSPKPQWLVTKDGIRDLPPQAADWIISKVNAATEWIRGL